MAIKEISGDMLPVDPVKGKKTNQAENPKPSSTSSKDRAELSAEARSLFDAEHTKKLDEIRDKVERGYYDSPEVTEKVVDSILKEIKSSR